MAEIKYHPFFPRQFDKFVNSFDSEDMRKDIRNSLEEFKGYLKRGEPIPRKFKPHKVGNKWEVHLVSRGSDILVTYRRERDLQGNPIIKLLECIPHKKLKAELQAILANARERELTDDECLRAYDLYCRLYGTPKVR